MVSLPLTMGRGITRKTCLLKFLVVDVTSAYNVKKRAFGTKRNKIIKAEVEKLLKVNYIRAVQYPEWLANVVLVQKSNRKWRMCIGFTDLNRACPKDSFLLPRIDAMIDSTSGCELMSFLDETRDILLHVEPLEVYVQSSRRKVLGFIVSQRGIDANLEKIKAIIKIQSPNTVKEVQKLAGRIAALNHFISRSSDKGLPFFKVLKKIERFS
ncbi:UNVERIFIED_CONTAM: hypothetical protein Sradi_0813200 [Sesamum radiatum]|uniref:Uncharacterized protein n=1 Tax=Sesamum radiatum TaxID=300843 RepID=A0AAW2VRL5_SESRA